MEAFELDQLRPEAGRRPVCAARTSATQFCAAPGNLRSNVGHSSPGGTPIRRSTASVSAAARTVASPVASCLKKT